MKSVDSMQRSMTRRLRYIRQLGGKKSTQRALLLAMALYFIPKVVIFYFVCGFIDVMRNRPITLFTFYQYFLGHGSFTWFLSPFNLLMDLLTLPFWNKGVYELKDLPGSYQDEITSLMEGIDRRNLVGELERILQNHNREMIFFKWYGQNIDTTVDSSEFHKQYKYIRTIGVSIFNKNRSTNKHFGPFRITLRMLYNIGATEGDDAYIEVGGKRNYWRRNRLFIFDDTLFHQSINGSGLRRYCVFVDILRPSLLPAVLRAMLSAFGHVLVKRNHVFYRGWAFLK